MPWAAPGRGPHVVPHARAVSEGGRAFDAHPLRRAPRRSRVDRGLHIRTPARPRRRSPGFGCARSRPIRIGLNAVVALPDGGFAATNFDPRPLSGATAPGVSARVLSGDWNGEVWERHPTTGWAKVPGSEASGANGLEILRPMGSGALTSPSGETARSCGCHAGGRRPSARRFQWDSASTTFAGRATGGRSSSPDRTAHSPSCRQEQGQSRRSRSLAASTRRR